jgi:hypothetical protein
MFSVSRLMVVHPPGVKIRSRVRAGKSTAVVLFFFSKKVPAAAGTRD